MAGFPLVPSGRGDNYTGMLTRSIVFSGALIIFLATTGMTIAAIVVPNWIAYDSYVHKSHIHANMGLHKYCSNTAAPPPGTSSFTGSVYCESYPKYQQCKGDSRFFCSMWRSVGFLMSFGVVLEGMTIAAFAVLLIGGKQKREQGWRFMATMAALAAIVQLIAMSIVSYLFDNDDKFIVPGWYLDRCYSMCTASWALQLVVAAAITLAALYLPSEGGYELIPDGPYHDDEP